MSRDSEREREREQKRQEWALIESKLLSLKVAIAAKEKTAPVALRFNAWLDGLSEWRALYLEIHEATGRWPYAHDSRFKYQKQQFADFGAFVGKHPPTDKRGYSSVPPRTPRAYVYGTTTKKSSKEVHQDIVELASVATYWDTGQWPTLSSKNPKIRKLARWFKRSLRDPLFAARIVAVAPLPKRGRRSGAASSFDALKTNTTEFFNKYGRLPRYRSDARRSVKEKEKKLAYRWWGLVDLPSHRDRESAFLSELLLPSEYPRPDITPA